MIDSIQPALECTQSLSSDDWTQALQYGNYLCKIWLNEDNNQKFCAVEM